MRVTVVCEKNFGEDASTGRLAYPEGMGECLAGIFREGGAPAKLILCDEGGAPDLTEEVLRNTDVLVWWGHMFHPKITDEQTEQIARRVQCGMGAIFLHSAHDSKPFKRFMGTSCSLLWREVGERERLWCLDPTHPIARGLGDYVDVPQEEMYGEFFDIPVPDELVYVGWFEGGEVFRAGCVFHRGRGKVFYFNPGHETYPTYRIPQIRQLLWQAAEYIAPQCGVADGIGCRHTSEFSVPVRRQKPSIE